MSKMTIEQAASVLREIKTEVKEGAIKETRISQLTDIEMMKTVGHVVYMTLSAKYDYSSPVLENWRKRLEAEEYVLSVEHCRLQVRFYVSYK